MAPDIKYPSTEPWLRLLLTTAMLERAVSFFAAAIASFASTGGGVGALDDDENKEKTGLNASNTWTLRMEFIWQMRTDWAQVLASVKEPP